MPEPRQLTERELAALGRDLASRLAPRSVIHLRGDLGSGKTTLVRAMAGALGAEDTVSSPTYALVHHYHGRRGDIYHVDCFRLRHPAEAADLDWDTLAEADALFVEWPERGGSWVPAPTLSVVLAHGTDDGHREVTVS